ncbi:class I SAM-dependent methyltransferase [Candidatus Acetothermia bacterium]|nr:class I SAM-dependent methyltransferase [Candidatus Acetothermia bacterium]MBI3643671.1 class I SAM-dependent methyltransferase [Candidatus Acetothermia bacterium]
MKRSEFTAANRVAWNEAAPVHRKLKFDELIKNVQKPDFNCLDQIATSHLQQIGVKNKDVAQLCCNNGRELISVKNMGAKRCVGFDISDAFIAQGRELNAVAKRDCEFVQSDVYEIPEAFNQQFDLVFMTIGALCWLPDMSQFLAVVARLLRPEGSLFIYEMHPILDMYECNKPEDRFQPHYSYFRTEPFVEEDGLDYFSKTKYKSATQYGFHHTLADIIGACIKNKLALRSFDEYGHDISNLFVYLEAEEIRLPLSFTLTAQLEP